MSGSAPQAEEGRAWWAPLLGVGSIGFGGFQVLLGIAFVAVGLSAPPASLGMFLLFGAAWALPGALLGVGGVMVTTGARRGRLVSLAAVLVWAATAAAVVVERTSIPPAVAAAAEWGLKHPSAPKWALKLYEDETKRQGIDAIAYAREPENAEPLGTVYAAINAAVPFPWYATVLFACAGPWGRRLAARQPKAG